MALASRLNKTGHDYLLSSHFEDYKLAAKIPMSHIDVGLDHPHPVLKPSDFIRALDSHGKLDLLFMGNGPKRYEDFWLKWKPRQPKHPIYEVHGSHLSQCIPIMLHADEGTSLKKKGLMVLSIQPCLGHGTSKRKADESMPGVNFLGKSLITRFLFSVMLTRVYSGKQKKNKPLYRMLEHLAIDLNNTFRDGIRCKVGGEDKTLYLVPLAMKGDWPALVKCGELKRHHLRDVSTKSSGAGICHLCLGGQESHEWHDVSYNNMKRMRIDCPPPWSNEPHLMRHLPVGEPYKHLFFRIDLFHTLHKGVFGDIAANAIATWHFYRVTFTLKLVDLLFWCPLL